MTEGTVKHSAACEELDPDMLLQDALIAYTDGNLGNTNQINKKLIAIIGSFTTFVMIPGGHTMIQDCMDRYVLSLSRSHPAQFYGFLISAFLILNLFRSKDSKFSPKVLGIQCWKNLQNIVSNLSSPLEEKKITVVTYGGYVLHEIRTRGALYRIWYPLSYDLSDIYQEVRLLATINGKTRDVTPLPSMQVTFTAKDIQATDMGIYSKTTRILLENVTLYNLQAIQRAIVRHGNKTIKED